MKTWLILCVTLLFPAASYAEPFPRASKPYSAEYTMHVENQGQIIDIEGEIHADGLKERHEHKMVGMPGAVIIRGDKKVSWVLMPQQKMYMEQDIGAAEGSSASFAQPQDVELRMVGTETVNGYATTKYEMSAKTNDGEKVDGTLWLTEEKIPVRMEGKSAQGTFRRELRNIQIGQVDSSKFELPEGFTKFAMPQIPNMPQGQGADAMRQQMQEQMQKMMQGMDQD